MRHGEQHIHQRIRIHKLHQKYPHPNPKIAFLDKTCMVVAVVMPLTVIPQIYKIFYYQIATGVSLLMWILYSILCVPMLIYGLVHKVKPIVVLNFFWLIMQVIVIVGVLIFG